jgi:NAD-dependent deacetylase
VRKRYALHGARPGASYGGDIWVTDTIAGDESVHAFGTFVGQSIIMTTPAHTVAKAIEEAKGTLVVVTGAGISLASGIPTFRGSDPDAIWAKDVTEMATFRYFAEDPAGSWVWYRRRFANILAAQPNAAHRALARLERWQAARGGNFLLVSQNIDVLHEQAGSARVVKVHGSANRCRCSNEDCRFGTIDSFPLDAVDFSGFDREPSVEHVPRCTHCGALVRPHVLWFDESYTSHADYQWHVVDAAATRVGVLLCVGTSLAVGVTAFLQHAAVRVGSPLFLVDPGRRPAESRTALVHIRERAEVFMPELIGAYGLVV